MRCASPIQAGPNKGQLATGTMAGWYRHHRAGEPPCDGCAEASRARNAASADYKRAWAAANPEKVRAYDARYRGKDPVAFNERARARDRVNRVARSESQRRWREANPEKVRAIKRAWAAANPEKISASNRQQYVKNAAAYAEYQRRWRQANKPLRQEQHRRRRAHKRQVLTVKFTPAELAAKFAYWGDRCWMCGGGADQVDHVKPLSAGGPHCLANLRPACGPCNIAKRDRWPLQ